MAATEKPHEALSLAQVEEELRSAEVYLTAGQVPFHTAAIAEAIKNETSGAAREDSNFRRKLTTRPVLSEKRRREILAKLSSERRAVLYDRQINAETTDRDAVGELHHEATVKQRTYRTPGERHQLIENLLDQRKANLGSEPATEQEFLLGIFPAHDIDTELGDESKFQHEANTLSGSPSVESEEEEIYYASDILDTAIAADIHPRSRLDFAAEGIEMQQKSYFQNVVQSSSTQMESPKLSNDQVDEPVSPLRFETLPAKEKHTEKLSKTVDIGQFADVPRQLASEQDHPVDRDHAEMTRVSNRLEFLSQPRNRAFAEREKQRLLLEMEKLRECTFHPNVLKPSRSNSRPGALGGAENAAGRSGTAEFQWLTLSPRQKICRRASVNDDSKEKCENNVMHRLHLDGSARYDSREQARLVLEAQQLQECTFKPKINPTSKSMVNMVDYKPIHHRISELQRTKAEYIERIREQLDRKECGPLSFTPMINRKSREIATTKLADREVEDSKQHYIGASKSQNVTERLAEDAGGIAERRLAAQEYFDMLSDQPFAPTISDTSRKIAQQRPEFKMDFVSRQDYFKSREQEKIEALEELCDARGGKASYKPDIGNAEGVLKQLRPDRCIESSQQKLYRLTYDDQREAELKKQRLREEQYAQYTFKPEINPVSKVLGRSSTIDELSHPVLGLQQDVSFVQHSPTQERTSGGDVPASGVALRQYFANKRFRSRVALEMEEASKAECTFQPSLIASRNYSGCASTSKLYNKESRPKTKLEWQSENLLHLIEAERQKKAEAIEAKRNALELKELEECTFRPNLQKTRRKGKPASDGSPSPSRDAGSRNKPVIVRGLGRFLELRNLARKQQSEQKQREQKVFEPNTTYEPRSYTVPKPFKLSETSKESIQRSRKMREEMRTKERQECTFRPQTISSQNRCVLQNMLKN